MANIFNLILYDIWWEILTRKRLKVEKNRNEFNSVKEIYDCDKIKQC